jgi:assimilatory nitrate reductase catalytic subunit
MGSPREETERRLYADGHFYTPSGKARLLYSPHTEMPEMPDDTYPMILLTGRGTSSQWHTQSRTAKSPVLSRLAPATPYLELHPEDASEIHIQQGDLIEVQTRRGSLEVAAYLAPTVQRGQVFLPMHYHGVNRLTHPTFDPHSRQPSYKACACRVQTKGGEFIPPRA